jgi:hypothetical protein
MGKIADVIRNGASLSVQKQQQLLTLDREFEKMETEIQSLKTKVLHLEAKVHPLEREVDRLKQQERDAAHSAQAPSLDKESEAIIKLLAESHKQLTLPDIATRLSVHPTRTEHFLNELTRKGYLRYNPGMGGLAPPVYGLAPSGQAYAVEHGFV